MSRRFLVYGANGYTGKLIAEEAARRGLAPVLAGRSEARVRPLAERLSLEWSAFGLDDADALARALEGHAVVLHCAGPFSRTSTPMVEACLRSRAHYLDITGEIPVFEAIFGRHEAARAAGVALVPGVGFDVVPTDCVAAILAARVPDATSLDLALAGFSRVSPGTLKTMVENIHAGGLVRKDGALVSVPVAHRTRAMPFARGAIDCVAIPWGDLSTAYRSTGIPNITTWAAAPPVLALGAKLLPLFRGLLGRPGVQSLLSRQIEKHVHGPDEATLERGRVHVFGEVENAAGRRERFEIETPEAYRLTALAALAAVEALLAWGESGAREGGAFTPSQIFGRDFVLGLPGVTRVE